MSSSPVSRVLVVVARIIWPLGVAVAEVGAARRARPAGRRRQHRRHQHRDAPSVASSRRSPSFARPGQVVAAERGDLRRERRVVQAREQPGGAVDRLLAHARARTARPRRATKSRSHARATARTASPASAAPAATAAATARCESAGSPLSGAASTLASASSRSSSSRDPLPRARHATRRPARSATPRTPQRVAARHDQPDLALPEMHEHDGFPRQQVADVGVVVAPRLARAADAGPRHRPARAPSPPGRERCRAGPARPRPIPPPRARARRARGRRCPPAAAAARPPATSAPAAHPLGHSRARAVARGDQARAPQLAIRARHGARRAPQLRRQRPRRRQGPTPAVAARRRSPRPASAPGSAPSARGTDTTARASRPGRGASGKLVIVL